MKAIFVNLKAFGIEALRLKIKPMAWPIMLPKLAGVRRESKTSKCRREVMS